MIKTITFLTALFALVCISQSQFITITNDAQYKAAINNTNYAATIVDLMTTTCGWSKYMKPIFENLASQYKNFLFAEVFFNNYYPSSSLVPGLYNGSFGLPVIMIYKKGVKVEGSPAVRSQATLESMITRNGG